MRPELGRRRRNPLAIFCLFLFAALLFWEHNPVRVFLQERSESTPEPAEASLGRAQATAEPSLGEGGGFKDGRGALPSSPPPRAALVSEKALSDGRLRLVVLGDEQAAGGWPELAASRLQERLKNAELNVRSLAVELERHAIPGWTAEEAYLFARDSLWTRAPGERPELIVVALGWHDGRGRLLAERRAALPSSDRLPWLTELSQLSVLPKGGAGFYLGERRDGYESVAPLRHLKLLDALGAEAAAHGSALYYLEQPIYRKAQGRSVQPSTAMRPQPWIASVFALEHEPKPLGLFQKPDSPKLSAAGNKALGELVGKGLVQAVLRTPTKASTTIEGSGAE